MFPRRMTNQGSPAGGNAQFPLPGRRGMSNYDRFVRLLGGLAVVGVLYVLLRRLSAVLVPFFLAWLIAYLLYPIVCFFQYKCRLRSRLLATVVTLLLIIGVLCVAAWLIVPSVAAEFSGLKQSIVDYVGTWVSAESPLAGWVRSYMIEHLDLATLTSALSFGDLSSIVQRVCSGLFTLVSGSLQALLGFVASLFAIVYLFFILLDYERMSEASVRMIPPRYRALFRGIRDDVQHQMNAYFRGQSLIALLVGIGFATGFVIVGYPMAIPLGLFIGVLNLVPYLQVVGVIPTVMLAGLRAYQTGENFWYVLLLAGIVFVVVQSIQDWVLIPRIMGKVTGYNGAIIFLALSVWGSLLGLVGMIIALPLTSIIVSYYKRYVLRDQPNEQPPPAPGAGL